VSLVGNEGRNIFVDCVRGFDLTPEMTTTIARLKMTFWKYDLASQIEWMHDKTDPDDRHLILFDGSECVGYLRLTERHAFGRTREPVQTIIGVSTVVVSPRVQKKGYGKTLMEFANSAISADSSSIGALCCVSQTVEFYKKCGWKESPLLFFRADEPQTKFFQDPNVLTLGAAISALDKVAYISGSAF
jgi:predicted GNAT family N-acyltransferase